jgi:hypothetical protein
MPLNYPGKQDGVAKIFWGKISIILSLSRLYGKLRLAEIPCIERGDLG